MPSPAHDARVIFGQIDGREAAYLLTHTDTVASEKAEAAIKRRAAREPLQYIIGEVAFFNESYRVGPDCLIPRPDTEILVEYAVKHIPEGKRFIDLCTGSGCIAISTLCSTVGTTAAAVDISETALEVASVNAESNGVSERLTLLCRDLLSPSPLPVGEKYYAVLSNPPYIASEVYEGLEPELFFEPRQALVAEDGGRRFYDLLVPLGLSILEDGGFLAFEIGYDQAEHLRALAREYGAEAEIIKDYSGNDRVAVIRRTA